MPDQDYIVAIEQRLAAARQRLATLLRQQTMLGPAHVPPGVVADIADARTTIQYCKSVLRGYEVIVDEQLDDKPAEDEDTIIGAHVKERVDVLARLQSFWIEGVLNQSLHGVALLELGLSYKPEAVKHPWEMVVEVPGLQTAIVTGTPIIQIFDAQDGRLLILGAPGAGKTTMLLELARALIERARADRRFPLPVILHLAHWSPIRADKRPRSFADWVVEEIAVRYDVSAQAAQEWLRQSILILLLDGLDEVANEYRQPCVEAINEFRRGHSSVRLVVCSRIGGYEHLQRPLNMNSAIRIAPLTRAQIDAYLQRLGERTNIVRDLLVREQELQELATTPLLLNIMILAYQDLADLPSSNTVDTSWGIQIFTDYVTRMLRQKGMHRLYTNDKVIAWLSWIAGQLWIRNHSSFALSDINENWQPSQVTHLGNVEGSRASMIGGMIGVAVGSAVGGIGGPVGVLTGFGGGMIGSLAGVVVQNYVLRPIIRPHILRNLQQKGIIPEDFDDFLNHCVRLIFLRKVGVEYIFIHRLLLERLVLWDAPHVVFAENSYLNALRQYLAPLPESGGTLEPKRYTKFRWVLMQYYEAKLPEGHTPEGFIRWVDKQQTQNRGWFRHWFPKG